MAIDSSNSGSKSLDVGAQRIGALYAKAFLGVAEKAKQTDALLQEFDSFLDDVLTRLPQLETVLNSAVISPDDKEQLLERTVGKQASPIFLNFLKVVAGHGRMDCLRAINRAAHQQLAVLRGLVQVEVTTATPMDDALAREIEATVRSVTGGSPVLNRKVDPGLIGGVLMQIGDRVYDGSVATQLSRLRTKMIDRSVHEIQSRRDSFRSASGD